MAYTVFLSHSIEDTRIVDEIRRDLTEMEVDVYVAEYNPEPGKPLSEKVINGIKRSDWFLVLLTDVGVRSPWVNQEIGVAKAFNKMIIPMVEKEIETKIKGMLTGLEYILFDKANPKGAIKKVTSYVRRLKVQKEMTTVIGAIVLVIIFVVFLYVLARSTKG